MVYTTLEADEASRNSDIRLTQAIWYRYFQKYLFKNDKDRWCVELSLMFELPREDNIKRIRAKIQNEEKKFLPSDPEVRKQRKISEDDWYDWAAGNKLNPDYG